MDATINGVTFRIACCQRQKAKARTRIELEAWRAEEEGLRDAILHQNHVGKYRGRSPVILERYLMGFQDATALMRIKKVTQTRQSAAAEQRNARIVHAGKLFLRGKPLRSIMWRE